MNVLAGLEVATKSFLHNEPMFGDVPESGGVRMVGTVNEDVALRRVGETGAAPTLCRKALIGRRDSRRTLFATSRKPGTFDRLTHVSDRNPVSGSTSRAGAEHLRLGLSVPTTDAVHLPSALRRVVVHVADFGWHLFGNQWVPEHDLDHKLNVIALRITVPTGRLELPTRRYRDACSALSYVGLAPRRRLTATGARCHVKGSNLLPAWSPSVAR